MKKKTKKVLLMMITIMAVTVILVIANGVLNDAYYYPESTGDEVSPFKVSTQLLAPSVHYMYEHHSFTRPHLFGTSELTFYFSKIVDSYMADNARQNENIGTVAFAFGKATASLKDNMRIGQLTYTQKFFCQMENPVSWENIQQDKLYEVYVGFNAPVSLEEAIAAYSDLFYYRYNNQNIQKGGVTWIPIKTSDNLDDVCVGAIASYGVPLFQKETFSLAMHGKSENSGQMAQSIMNHLQISLEYGVQNQDEASIYLNSGIFSGAENLRFQERLSYIQSNPVECLGMVVQTEGDVLLSYQNDRNMILLKITDQDDLLYKVQ